MKVSPPSTGVANVNSRAEEKETSMPTMIADAAAGAKRKTRRAAVCRNGGRRSGHALRTAANDGAHQAGPARQQRVGLGLRTGVHREIDLLMPTL